VYKKGGFGGFGGLAYFYLVFWFIMLIFRHFTKMWITC